MKAHVIEVDDVVIVERRDDGKVKLQRLGSELEPGRAAVIVLVRKMSADKVLPEIKVPGTVIQTSLSNADEQGLQQALDAARA